MNDENNLFNEEFGIPDGHKRCSGINGCDGIKPFAEFYNGSNGYMCKKCKRLQNEIISKKYPQKRTLGSMRTRALVKGYCLDTHYSITEHDCIPDEFCPNCGIKMEKNELQPSDNSPSGDEFIPGLGYHPWNFWMPCHKCNREKYNLSADEHIKLGLDLKIKFARYQESRGIFNHLLGYEAQKNLMFEPENNEVFHGDHIVFFLEYMIQEQVDEEFI